MSSVINNYFINKLNKTPRFCYFCKTILKTKIGILGGGQLGLMFIQNAVKYPVEIYVMDPDKEAPCKAVAHHFTQGSFRNYDDVLNFGRQCEVLGIEIEHVHVGALKKLQEEGVSIIPFPRVIETIQDKGLQKEFYKKYQIPTAPFFLIENKEDFFKHNITFPVVQKTRKDGYDGKGVQIIYSKEELNKLWDMPSIIETIADIKMEMAVIVCVDEKGNQKFYTPVEMVFDEKLNLLDYLICPSDVQPELQNEMIAIACKVAGSFASPGVFAIEFFLNKDHSIWVNETACRVHNSGHHTIESAPSTQFDQMLRIMTSQPLGDTTQPSFAGIYNLIGSEGHEGAVVYKGLEEVEAMPDTFVHLYNKLITKPGRKMGHVTVLAKSKEELIEKLEIVKSKIKVLS